jgi:hypothetical protein
VRNVPIAELSCDDLQARLAAAGLEPVGAMGWCPHVYFTFERGLGRVMKTELSMASVPPSKQHAMLFGHVSTTEGFATAYAVQGTAALVWAFRADATSRAKFERVLEGLDVTERSEPRWIDDAASIIEPRDLAGLQVEVIRRRLVRAGFTLASEEPGCPYSLAIRHGGVEGTMLVFRPGLAQVLPSEDALDARVGELVRDKRPVTLALDPASGTALGGLVLSGFERATATAMLGPVIAGTNMVLSSR